MKAFDFSNSSARAKLCHMIDWFRDNFVLIDNTDQERFDSLYEYRVIPAQELEMAFHIVLEDRDYYLIEEAAKALSTTSDQYWIYDFDDAVYWEDNEPDAYGVFETSIERVLEMCGKAHNLGGNEIIQHLFQILYANIFTSFEAYMVRAFINKVFETDSTLELYLSNQKEFQFENPKLTDLLKGPEHIQAITEARKRDIKNALIRASWHDLSKVTARFNHIGVRLNIASSNLHKIITTRNDIVHRNGHTIDDVAFVISRDEISEAIATIKGIASSIRASEIGLDEE